MAATPLFTGPGGIDPAEDIRRLARESVPTIGDSLHAGKYLEAKILERTARGVDATGAAFAPYSQAYAKQKAKKLGHANTVDLFGASRRHMLMSLVVHVNGSPAMASTENPQPATLMQLGFWDETAIRAKVHNEGATKMPRRAFFHASPEDLKEMQRIVALRIDARLKRRR